MDDEIKIDLRPMIEILILRWRWIVGVPAAVTFMVLVYALFIPRVYEARVFVAVSRQRVEVQFGTQIQTLSEDQIAAQSQISRDARLATFRELVVNPAIGEKVLPQYADRLRELDEDLLNTSLFLAEHVSVDQNTKSDLIGIVISLRDPVLAADIANAWAQAYEEHINKLYASAIPADVEAVRVQAGQAQKTYSTFQSELESYLANNPIPRLQKQMGILQTQINSYQTALVESEALVTSRELATRRQMLDGYYQDLVNLEKVLGDARLLQKQIENGEISSASAFGDSLAMIFLRSRNFTGAHGVGEVSTNTSSNEEDTTTTTTTTSAGDAPFSLQLQTPLISGPVAASDVAGLILALEQSKTETEAAIDELTAILLDPPQFKPAEDAGTQIKDRIEEWTVELQSLDAQLEAEVAHHKDLERQRDLAWSTYSQLASKTVEVGVAAESGGTEVRVASQSLPPAEPVHTGKLTIIIMTGLGSLVLTIFSVFAFEWWRKWNSEEALQPVPKSVRKKN